ncbi:endonuclease domain-containing protein [Pedobacter polaris]|uniref:Endonuclease domain-containing protein n=1 Tax=Pedobacter polaris TaxID=2571273 RepID=A0A4U1CMR2_9SPHI|nr:endonuclease domain-containing protein [Pedobacter polaris]TKC08399.1 endonuclease domain-containing protein [Pedobacter polaris]
MEPAKKDNTWHYNKSLRGFANLNRKDMTKSEACIWKYLLSRRQMLGYQFRRQRPVLNFIADFMCKELMLIIECDGLTHQWEENIPKDIARQKQLENIGYKVLRFRDDEVLNDIENVNRTIIAYIEDFQKENR